MSPSLLLFFTRGVSLKTWAMMGMLQREVAVYKRFLEAGWKVAFLTYGNASDLDYREDVAGIEILCNTEDASLDVYEAAIPTLFRDYFRSADLFKTNQTYGGDLALELAREFHKPLVARCGYMWSANAAREHSYDSPQAELARDTERRLFSNADAVIVTTETMREDVSERVPTARDRLNVIANYVDTDLFQPIVGVRDLKSVLFVGRIAREKNLSSLLKAVTDLPLTLTLIGEGRLRLKLQEEHGSMDGRVVWEGNVPNGRLPEFMNAAGVFVLPSLYEGHPKALLEAMSCGTPVIGADSPGIREVIQQGENGLLCSPDADGIRDALRYLIANPEAAATLGANARAYVLEHFALNSIFKQEHALYQRLLQSGD